MPPNLPNITDFPFKDGLITLSCWQPSPRCLSVHSWSPNRAPWDSHSCKPRGIMTTRTKGVCFNTASKSKLCLDIKRLNKKRLTRSHPSHTDEAFKAISLASLHALLHSALFPLPRVHTTTGASFVTHTASPGPRPARTCALREMLKAGELSVELSLSGVYTEYVSGDCCLECGEGSYRFLVP